MSTLKGIDISEHQAPSKINYDILAKCIDYAILRVGYTGWGTGTSLNPDASFEAHYNEFIKRGTPVGVYWYSCATTLNEGVAEANEVLRLIKDKKIEYPIYWDTEDNYHQRPSSKADLTLAALGFCKTIAAAGYMVGIYASASWYNSELTMAMLAAYEVWVAHYGVSAPSYSGAFGMWQHTSVGRLDGYASNLDMNLAYKDYPAIIRAAGLNHLAVDVPIVVAPTPPTPHNYNEGDTVLVNGQLFSTAAGGGPGRSLSNHKGKITIYHDGGAKPYHIDGLGWVAEASLGTPKPFIPVTRSYTVKSGDTLWGISRLLGTTVAYLVAKNGIQNANLIHVGQIIKY